MKRLFIVLMLTFSFVSFAQQSTNRFEEESTQNIDENRTSQNVEGHVDDPQLTPPGNPGDIVPIDDYVPALLIIALGIIIHTTQQKKKKLLS